MSAGQANSLRLFRLFGIDVYLHWTWFLVAVAEIYAQWSRYHSPIWKVVEYLALFLIVLLHEFGHALACRQVGGKADRIMLWPLGGVAYVTPPERPGAWLWSIAAGPLVNVALLLVSAVVAVLLAVCNLQPFGPLSEAPDWIRCFFMMAATNVVLLGFNLLPFYPLDGGQILQSVLWFFIGRARSLAVVAYIGFLGVALLGVYAIYQKSLWIGLIAFFAFARCRVAVKQAARLLMIDGLPRRQDHSCPGCKAAPPIGEVWRCSQCKATFDPFATGCTCPKCQTPDDSVQCMACKTVHPFIQWRTSPPSPPTMEPDPAV